MKVLRKRVLIVSLILIGVLLMTGCASIGKKILNEVEEQIGDVDQIVTGDGDGEFNINLPMVEMEGNSEGTRKVEGDLEKLLIVKSSGEIDKYEEEFIQGWSYTSTEDQEKLVAYFKDLVKDTVDYYFLGTTSGAVIMGAINELQITISVEFGDKTSIVEVTAIKFSN